ncbi:MULTISPECIES: hypothetical protein [Acinetobacter]|uniref:DUF968 domain-containing protein n=1 Tax=Acinetobacter TaxID=469 RepID=UPI001F4B3161|nr:MULTISPECIES: hypothetical protein [Acinetobacter]MCH7381622.1 hypothetical protein [Acinetobacter higginsii]
MRDAKRLAEIRKLPCIKCGSPAPSQAAHSNFGEHGKGRGIKAQDSHTIPLCVNCHRWLDGYFEMTREQSKEWFAQALEKTNQMLEGDKDIF